jgi:predicted acetyltransferase
MTASGEGDALRLRPLTLRDEDEARAAHRELAAEGFEFLLGLARDDDWGEYLGRLDRERAGVALPEGRVPATFLVGDVAGVVVGRVSVRHALNEYLAHVGGHIGYSVRPAYRGRGFATAMLRQALAVAASVGVDGALVTCDDGNVASFRTIERCGGVLQDTVPSPGAGRPTRRYRVPTSGPVSGPAGPGAG